MRTYENILYVHSDMCRVVGYLIGIKEITESRSVGNPNILFKTFQLLGREAARRLTLL